MQYHETLLTMTPLPHWNAQQSPQEREATLMHLFQLVVGGSASQWLNDLRTRFHSVVFYQWLKKEVRLRQRSGSALLMILTFSEFAEMDEFAAILSLLQQLRPKLPLGLRTFVKDYVGKDRSRSAKEGLRLQLRKMSRWHAIQQRVGWLGVAFGHTWSADPLNTGSDAVFKNMVDVLCIERHRMAEILEDAWPTHPPVLLSVGGKSVYVNAYS
jgi:hypothetical protein